MYIVGDLPDIVSLYKADLRRFESLSDPQILWLGIVIDSEKILEKLLKDKDPNDERICDFLFIGVLNKIREIHDHLVKFSSPKFPPLIEYIAKTIEEIVEFKHTSIPLKNTIHYSFIDAFPDHSYAHIFDLTCFLWLLPPPILNFYLVEISQTHRIPTIAKTLDVLNPLDSVSETKTIFDRINFAKAILIESFLVYVRFIAYRFQSRGLDYEDVIQEGNLGLMKAVDKFDIRQGVKFKTFGLWWIRQSIMRAIAEHSRTIRLPVHLFERISKLLLTRNFYRSKFSEEPSIPVLAVKSGFTIEDVTRLIEYTKPNISFEKLESCENNLMRNYLTSYQDPVLLPCKNCPFAKDELLSFDNSLIDDLEPTICLEQDLFGNVMSKSDRAKKLLEKITDDQNEDELSGVQTENLNTSLQSAMDILSPRHSKLLKLRYGFDNGEGMTLDEVGQKLGVTRERIRQMESSALGSLRKSHFLRNRWR